MKLVRPSRKTILPPRKGPPETEIHGVAGIDQAIPGQISSPPNKRYTPLVKTTQASAVPDQKKVPHSTATQISPG